MRCTGVLVAAFVVFSRGFSPTLFADSLPPTAGTYTTVSLPPGAVINGINDTGQLAGSITDSTGTHGFLDSHGTFTQFDDPGNSSTVATGINNAGQIVGRNTSTPINDFSNGAFLYANGSFTDLGGRVQTSPAINNAGQIVVTTAGFIDFSVDALLYSSNGTSSFVFSFFPPPPDDAANVYVTGLNDSGQFVGYWMGGIEHGGFRDAGQLFCQGQGDNIPCSDFNFPASPTGINDAGEIVGSTGADSGLLERNGVFTGLDFSPTSINNLGQIVGGGDFIFTPTPVPEPRSLLLLGGALAAIAIGVRRRRSRADKRRRSDSRRLSAFSSPW